MSPFLPILESQVGLEFDSVLLPVIFRGELSFLVYQYYKYYQILQSAIPPACLQFLLWPAPLDTTPSSCSQKTHIIWPLCWKHVCTDTKCPSLAYSCCLGNQQHLDVLGHFRWDCSQTAGKLASHLQTFLWPLP